MDGATVPPDPPSADGPDADPVEPFGLEHRSRLLFLVAPILLSLGLWGLCWAFMGRGMALEVLTAVGASLTILGPSVILGPAVLGPGVLPNLTLSSWHLAWVIAYTSVLTAFLYAYNLDLFERIPRVGGWFRRVRLGAQRTLRGHKWIRRLATVGVAVFVITPLPGSGSLGGAIVGRLIGLGPLRTFLATGVAGVIVAFGYGYFGATLKAWLDAHEVGTGLRIAGVLAFLVLLLYLVRLLRWLARKAPAEATPPTRHDRDGGVATA